MMNMLDLPAKMASEGMSFSDRASEAFVMVVMGMAMVFLVLSLIMLVLLVMERVFAKDRRKEAPKAPAAPQKAAAPAPVPTAAPAFADDGAVVAAITAAISVMLAESNDPAYQGGFRVVSFKRSSHNTPWNSAR